MVYPGWLVSINFESATLSFHTGSKVPGYCLVVVRFATPGATDRGIASKAGSAFDHPAQADLSRVISEEHFSGSSTPGIARVLPDTRQF